MQDRNIKFEAFLALALGLPGRHIGTITAIGYTPANTPYEKRNSNNNITDKEVDNFVDGLQLTMQYADGAAVPAVNELLLLVPTADSIHDRELMGVYKMLSKPVPTQSQAGVRTVQFTGERSQGGAYLQEQFPAQPALLFVESGTAGSGTYTYRIRNQGGAQAESGTEYLIVNCDRLIEPTGFEFPATIDGDAMTFTPGADIAAGAYLDVVMTPVAP